jgi:hypothetical protein
MKRITVLVAATLVALGGFTVAPAQAAPYCGITWGSLAKADSHMTGKPITNLRAGRHDCYDRLVVDIGPSGLGRPGYTVSYVPVVTQDGSGAPIPLAGGAFLQVGVNAPGHDANYNLTYRPANPSRAVNVTGFTTFRQVAWGGTFEGVSTIGLGVRARLPFRVLVLAGPGTGYRLVIDVAHRW